MKRFLAILVTFILLMLSAYLLFRDYFLETAIGKIQNKISTRYDADLLIDEAYFEGFATVHLNGISLIPPAGDTLLYLHKVTATISPWRFLKGLPPVNDINVSSGTVQLREYPDSTDNFRFLFTSTVSDTAEKDSIIEVVNYEKLSGKLWKRFFAAADFNIDVSNFLLNWKTPVYREEVIIHKLNLNESKFECTASDSTAEGHTNWNINGILDAGEEAISMEGDNGSNESREIPFFKKITGITIFIQKFGISFSKAKQGYSVYVSAISPGINHWRISPEDVVLDSIRARMEFRIKDNKITSGEESAFYVNQIPVRTGFMYAKQDSTQLGLNIEIREMPAQDFFNSLPKGLFSTLEGIKVKGLLSYHLTFNANLRNPDSLVFDSQLKKSGFRIIKYGTENFESINNTFTHTVREKDVVVRNIVVGPENPNYIPLEFISPLLVNAVLTAEDGTFRYHKGFNEEAFRQSIATNIREKRFARGGSTITMQLVKNVFLHRNKTISRKVEEALIVWLIENNNLVTKDRILEVYLNIIEWGPGIYGIGEASQFYFAKHPSQLSLEESIYLSSIIPRPKTFRYTFDKEGKMKEYLKGYFDLVAGRMLRKEIITQEVHDSLKYQIELRGPALQMVLPDSIPADSLFIDQPEELF